MASLLGDVKNEGFVVSTSEQFATRTCPQEMYCKGFEILVISCLKYPVVEQVNVTDPSEPPLEFEILLSSTHTN